MAVIPTFDVTSFMRGQSYTLITALTNSSLLFYINVNFAIIFKNILYYLENIEKVLYYKK